MQLTWSRRSMSHLLAIGAALCVVLAATLVVVVRSDAATPPQLDLDVLLIGAGSSDPTTAAWQSALSSEGVNYTSVTAAGAYGSETVTLPALTTGATANFNGVVFADSPSAFAAGQLTALDSFESTFRVRQIDGYSYPSPALGQTDVTGAALDGTTAQLTAAGLAGLPALKGPVPFDTGTYGYPATADAGAPFTPWIENTAGQVLGGVYQHPSTDPQAGVTELSLNFDYNATQLQWLLLAPGLIDWVTQGNHLGLYRNYFGQDIDDNFISDNEWSSQYQCTPGATEPPDYTCPAGVANNPADTPPDVQMSAADVAYVVAWEKQTGITLNLAFNGIGACTAPSAAAESSANCTGSVKDAGGTFTDPGQVVDASYPNDQALINALLADKADFNWIIHTWSHEFLGCIVWQPQALTSVTANATGGSFTAGSYSYEITAATAYGESEPSLPKSATVAANGSVTVTWPDATNGVGTDGTKGPTLAQEEANHTGGTAFWGYNVYRENPGSTTYGLVGQVAENPAGTTATYSFSDTGASVPGATPGSSDTFPTATNPGIDCSSAAGSWDPATSTAADSSIEQEIGLDQAWATANGLPNYTSSAVVTGEHSGIENPNMPAALAGTGVTTFAADASRQPTQYSLASGTNTAISAPRYPSNIYYNASNWPDELNEYNTLYAAPGVNLGNSTYPTETGHCDDTSSTTCLSTPATEATLLTSESRIMLSHVLANNPRVGYAHQTDLIGPATSNGADYGYTILTLINNMLSQYNSWTTTPLVQMTDVTEAQTLALQSSWAKAQSARTVTASVQNGTVTVTNTGTSAINVPVTAPRGTTVNGSAFGTAYGATLSGWESLAGGATLTLTQSVAPSITSANSATSIVGSAFNTTVTTIGSPTPALTETGTLPGSITFKDNGNGTATISGTPAAGSGGSYPITITATSSAGTATQAFTLTNDEAPAITSASTASFSTGISATYTVTTTGYPAPTVTESGTLPSGLVFSSASNGTATISGAAASGTAGTYSVSFSATNASGSTATLAVTITVTNASAPTITSGSSAYFTLGQSGSYAVTTTGSPTSAITEVGALDGLVLADQGNGTALLSGTPSTTGTFPVSITAANGVGPNASQTLSIIVGQGPVFASAASTAFTVGTAGTFTVTTTGSPAPSLGETGTLPTGVSFTDNGNGTATISGTPAAGTAGSYTLDLAAVNGTGTTSQSFTLSVDQAPAITSAGSATFTVGTAGSFAVTSTGSPAPAVTESGALPSGVVFTAGTSGSATIAGSPTAVGTFPITLTATNGVTPNAVQSFTLTVNQAPAITSAGSATFTVGTPGSFSVTTTGSPTATLSATSSPALPSGVTFTANSNGTATLAGVPPAGSQGVYALTVTASSAAGTATQVLTLTVNSGLAITSAATATATAGDAFSFTVTASGTPVPTLARTGTLPSGVTFTANSNGTATLAGTPAASAKGPYLVTLTAKNSTGTTSQAFTLTVDNVPSFTSAATLTETAGTAFTFTVATAGYPTPTLTSGTLPAGMSFVDNGNGTGSLAGTTAVGAGVYPVTVTAANGGGSTNQTITVTVKAAGTTVPVPTFTSAASATATAGTPLSFTVTTAGSPTTAYTTTVTHSGALPAGVSFSNNGNGTATLAGTPSATSGGTYPITFTATNSAGTTTQSFVLTVSAAPKITSGATATATDGSSLTFTVKTSGAPAPALTESGTLPQGVTWVDNGNGTATLGGAPGVDQGGVYKLTITATNTFGTATQAFTLTVDQAPGITSAASASATHGTAFSFTFTSTGYPLASVTHTGTVRGLTYTNNGNGTATLKGTPRTAGTYVLSITAKNAVGTTTQSFTLTVS